jgi:hypothetical protein
MGGSKSSSSNTTNQYDQSLNFNLESNGGAMSLGKILTDNAIDNSVTQNNYNLASDEKVGELSEALQSQAQSTAKAVNEQKNTTNEIVNSLQSTAKTNTIMISAVACAALIGSVYMLKRRK